MTLLEAIVVLLAGGAAGAINVVVGSGTLVTFPVLLAVGYSPLVANVSNTLGLVPGSVAGAVGYRRELRGRGRQLAEFACASASGGVLGAVLLLVLPESAFEVVVPVLVAAAVVMVAVQPAVAKRVGAPERGGHKARGGPLLFGLIFATGVYGGYFGAAQGVLLLGVMGLALHDSLQELNAIKNVLAGLVNGVAALVFIFAAEPAWEAVGLIAVGATLGGALGAKVARKLPPRVLRGVVIVVGCVAFVQLVQ